MSSRRFATAFTAATSTRRRNGIRPTASVAAGIALATVTTLTFSASTTLAGPIEAAGVAKKAAAARAAAPPDVDRGTFSAIRARMIGPALTGGRISDLAVHPEDHATYYVAVASGGVWKTTNNGVTFRPIFDSQPVYSIGCLAIDPNDSDTIWVGTGENNGQRSVSWGDGVYKSTDGGGSFRNVGLPESKHIGMIAIHPDDSNVVFVAAQGPLWESGGDRGLYRTTDGGDTWERVLHVDDDTGVNEVHICPDDPNTMYCSTWQRRRRQWTMINGGPGSGVYKSTDGGETWREVSRGLPGGDKGKVGLDISPVNPDVVYAVVEAKDGQTGFFRSTNRGERWSRMSDYTSSAPMYYHEIVASPHDVDTVYMMDTRLAVTTDGGRNFQSIQGRGVHVDHHALWINPDNPNHMINGNDGGVYETWDARTWQFKPNLPITQFYKVTADSNAPFYTVYGGTQDNNTLGGPARTRQRSMSNEDWFVTVGGDGFESQVDPEDSNLVYSQWQYGGLIRYDRRTGETTDIKPRPGMDEAPYVFNWDAPLLISPHSNTRLYFGGKRLHRSDDRGDSWRAVSGDLSRGIDRNELEIMGKVWPVDAVAKHRSTSQYGSIISVSESPLEEGLLYAGTDDGLIHVSEDDGENWRKVSTFPTVPDMSYVSCLVASMHDVDTVYATFDNHKSADFRPHILVSHDRGMNWTSMSGDLPDVDHVHAITEDHVRPGLLFVGTEFGAYYTLEGPLAAHRQLDGANGEAGKRPADTGLPMDVAWAKIAGLPTISVQDVHVQRQMNDLVIGTFGRGMYIVDDYSPLQQVTNAHMDMPAHIFKGRDALFYLPWSKGRGSQGQMYWTASNPPVGATMTYQISERAKRGPRLDDDATKPQYDVLREQERARPSRTWMSVRDADGDLVARMSVGGGTGVSRTTWNLRYAEGGFSGPYVLPGEYTVSIQRMEDGTMRELTGGGDDADGDGDAAPHTVTVKHLAAGTLQPSSDAERAEILAFHRDVVKVWETMNATSSAIGDLRGRISPVEAAVNRTLHEDEEIFALAERAHELLMELDALSEQLNGDPRPGRYQEVASPGLRARMGFATGSWRMTAPPTGTQRQAYEDVRGAIGDIVDAVREIAGTSWPELKADLDAKGVAWTPGRVPGWGE
ncbi:MAG: WD40/YVTN/BNR-like repeat-containing protein [Phycisphaerales bacterium]